MSYTEPTLTQRAEILNAYGESERLVRETERKQITSVSNTTWWRLSRKGQVPVAKQVGTTKSWLLSDLLLWIQHQ
ncbi:TPA: transcriptional regulator [Providencia stuartii]|uniref:transcriptional regulator n=1 Tax=Providencia stuartii TaxID=588 RepID=UPI002989E52E|nr:transcriptional regulator [Providencia stuartii]HEM6843092.1 transcriptional regulator [Providencia stuartii]